MLLFTDNSLVQVALQTKHSAFEKWKHPVWAVEFVNKLVAFFEQSCINDVFQVKTYILDSVL